jgi:hypothetical protein
VKVYIELDAGQFVVEADSVAEAIAALWERRADTCRNLDDILPEYWVHAGVSRLGGSYEPWDAFWLLSPSARHVVRNVVRSQLDATTFDSFCVILLNHYPIEN